MDDDAFGLITWIITGAVALVVVVAGIGVGFYVSDYGMEATVIDKQCGSSGTGGSLLQVSWSITVKTKAFGIEHTLEDVPPEQCGLINKGNFVRYHLQSQRTIVWQAEGKSCIYDTHEDFPRVCGQ